MRVVFDTNVLLSGLLWRGAPNECLLAAEGDLCDLCLSEPILEELHEKLMTKFGESEVAAAELVAYVRSMSEIVTLQRQAGWVKADPDDDKIIETAVRADAAYIVSGDRHLLELDAIEGLTILNSREFVSLLEL